MMSYAKQIILMLLIAGATCRSGRAQSFLDDSELRKDAAQRISQNHGVNVDWQHTPFMQIVDIESRLDAVKRIKQEHGVTFDWRKSSFVELMDAEKRMGSAQRIRQRTGQPVNWRNYTFMQLMQMERSSAPRGGSKADESPAQADGPERASSAQDEPAPSAPVPRPSDPGADSQGAPDRAPSAPWPVPQLRDGSVGSFVLIAFATLAITGCLLYRKSRALAAARAEQPEADNRGREAEQAAQEERQRRESSERARAGEKRYQAGERQAEEAGQNEGEPRRTRKGRQASPPRPRGREFYAGVLGLSEPFTQADLKKGYRDLVSQYHPDKVNHLGSKIREVAEREMKRINEAYDYLNDGDDIG